MIQNNKYFVLHGDCSNSDSESDGIPSDWEEGVDWNDQKSAHFEILLSRTVTDKQEGTDSGK